MMSLIGASKGDCGRHAYMTVQFEAGKCDCVRLDYEAFNRFQ